MSAQTEVNSDPVNSNPSPKTSNKKQNDDSGGRSNSSSSRRMIKCYCNDDIQCPRAAASSSTSSSSMTQKSRSGGGVSLVATSEELSANRALAELVGGGEARVCQTATVCVTKRLERTSGETWLRYGCDQSQPGSIKGSIIEYRDCLVHTGSPADRDYVMANAAEHCCSHADFCNVELEPRRAAKDLNDFVSHIQKLPPPQQPPPASAANTGLLAHNADHQSASLLKPVNLVLSCLSFAVFLVVIVLFVLYLYKKVQSTL